MPTGYHFWLDLKLLQAHLPDAISYCCSWFSGQAWKTWSVHALMSHWFYTYFGFRLMRLLSYFLVEIWYHSWPHSRPAADQKHNMAVLYHLSYCY